MKPYVRLSDDSSFPNIVSTEFRDMLWRCRYGTPTKHDINHLIRCADALDFLINHPAMTQKEVVKKISKIRKALAEIKDENHEPQEKIFRTEITTNTGKIYVNDTHHTCIENEYSLDVLSGVHSAVCGIYESMLFEDGEYLECAETEMRR